MFRGFFIAILLAAMLVSTVNACPDKVYVGLYADDKHGDCSQDVYNYSPFDVWLFVLPSTSYVECVELRLEKPEWLQLVGTELYPLIADPVEPIDWFGDGGIVCFEYCRSQWTWVCRFTMLPTKTGLTGYITVKERFSTGVMQATTCMGNRPIQPLEALNYLAINQPCVVGTVSSSWGAIKGMYKDQ